MVDLPYDLELDANVSYVDTIRDAGASSHVDLDLRVSWKPAPAWEWTLVGQNLIEDRHKEYGPSVLLPTEATYVPRGVYFSITYRR
jgi:iron complex outermembrane receptor protein